MRDIQKIASNYVRGFFVWDLLPVLPLQLIGMGVGEHTKYFYLIKIVRLYIGLDFLDASAIVQTLQHFNRQRLRNMIEK